MKIKTVKKMRLDELIKYIDGNEEAKGKYFIPTPLRGGVTVTNSRRVKVEGVYLDDTFTVEVEEELTNRTKLPDLVIVYNDNFIITDSDECISEYINDYDNESVSNRMYVPYKGGLKLVWSRKNGIPKHGTLELSE